MSVDLYYLLVLLPARIIAFPIALGLGIAPLIAGACGAQFTLYRLPKLPDKVDWRKDIAAIFVIIAWLYIILILYSAEYDIYFTLVEVSRHHL